MCYMTIKADVEFYVVCDVCCEFVGFHYLDGKKTLD